MEQEQFGIFRIKDSNEFKTERLVDLELAKRLKSEGYHKPCKYFYQDKDLPFSPKGLKHCKNEDVLNHNKYDDFIYSAPILRDGINYLIGKKMYFESSVVFKFGGNVVE